MAADSRSFGAGRHLYIVVGGFALFFVGTGVAAGAGSGDWTALIVASAAFGVGFLLLQVPKLEVSPDGFRYRNLSGSRSVRFADVGRAYFEVVDSGAQQAAAFFVARKDGSRVKVNLRTFPVREAAVLFDGLERSGVPVEVPDRPVVRRVADQIAAARAEPGA